mgnify:CR=1 FL=1
MCDWSLGSSTHTARIVALGRYLARSCAVRPDLARQTMSSAPTLCADLTAEEARDSRGFMGRDWWSMRFLNTA